MSLTQSTEIQAFVHLNQTFAAPREKVFEAWTNPQALQKWWGPPGSTTPVIEIDLQVGGRYRFGMQFPGEDIFFVSGVYREVQPPEKLVFTWRWEQPEMDFGESQVTLDFHERGNGTEVILRHEGFPDEELCQKHEQGWRGFLATFGKIVVQKEK